VFGIAVTLALTFVLGLEREEAGARHRAAVVAGVRTIPLIGLLWHALGLLSPSSLLPVAVDSRWSVPSWSGLLVSAPAGARRRHQRVHGEIRVVVNATTGSTGTAAATLRLKKTDPTGKYQVRADVSMNSAVSGTASTAFTVQSGKRPGTGARRDSGRAGRPALPDCLVNYGQVKTPAVVTLPQSITLPHWSNSTLMLLSALFRSVAVHPQELLPVARC